MTERPPIPEDMKRNVRQRCCFGCIVCGLPIFDYDHLERFADVGEHTIENIFLLCPNHHREKTARRLAIETLKRFAKDPFNRSRALTAGHHCLMVGDSTEMRIGNCIVDWDLAGGSSGHFKALEVGGIEVVGVEAEDGFLLLNGKLYDEAGNLALLIKRGELKVSTGVWDYRIEGQRLRIRAAARKISVEMEFTERGVNLFRASMYVPTGNFLANAPPPRHLEVSNKGVILSQAGRAFGTISGGRCSLKGMNCTAISLG